jgi:hypothetical protein
VAKKAGLAGKTEEKEIYTDIILELVVKFVAKKADLPGQDGEEVHTDIILELVRRRRRSS